MAFIVSKGERRLADVVERAYGAALKPAEAKRAEAALLAANPRLARLRDVKPGDVLVIPGLPGLKPPREDRDLGALRGETLAAAGAELDGYRDRLATRLDAERAALTGVADLLKSKEVKALAKALPDSAPYVERAASGVELRKAALNARAAFAKTLAKVRADFEAMARKGV